MNNEELKKLAIPAQRLENIGKKLEKVDIISIIGGTEDSSTPSNGP